TCSARRRSPRPPRPTTRRRRVPSRPQAPRRRRRKHRRRKRKCRNPRPRRRNLRRLPPRSNRRNRRPPSRASRPPPPRLSPPPPAKTAPAAAPAGADPKAQVNAAIEGWARAWSGKDVAGYLAYYAPEFEVPGGETRASWEKQRTERIERPKSIEVTVKVLSSKIENNEATVTFRQSYRSDTLRSNNTKTLKMVRSGDRWLIKQER